MDGYVIAVGFDDAHRFSKRVAPSIRLLAGVGVEGDAHAGATVKHRSRVAVDPSAPNLRQVHLISTEILDALAAKGFALAPGDLGENILTRGIDLLALPRGARLAIGEDAVIEITGLRNPCAQIEAFRPGLLAEVVGRGPDGSLVRRAGVMAVVIAGGEVRAGDGLAVTLPPPPWAKLERV
ncbi:MAG: MOSC domain-containing protein [Siculibacillus sp.]|nr:MOSC domain-containing protein [Siculibacillus sp.]